MSEARGAPEPRGPGWWLASDGKWYPPETTPTVTPPTPPTSAPQPGAPGIGGAPAPGWWLASDGKWYPPTGGTAAAATRSTPATSAASGGRRLPPLGIVAIAVLVVGLALAVFGVATGGADEGKRDELRAQIDRVQADLSDAEDQLTSAQALQATVLDETNAYLPDAQAIVTTAEEGCGCGEGLSSAWDQFIAAADAFYANPSQATSDAIDAVINSDLNPEGRNLQDIRDELEGLMVDRAPVPSTGGEEL